MKNFPIKDPGTGKEYWISRALAACIIVIARDGDDSWILLQQRGPGCPDFQGAWAHTCGYLDFDETLREAALREVFEEVGLNADTCVMSVYGYNDNPFSDPRQNVTIRYVLEVPIEQLRGSLNIQSGTRGGEPGEVSTTKLLKVEPGLEGTLESLDFAFNHRDLTDEVLRSVDYFKTAEDLEVLQDLHDLGDHWEGQTIGDLGTHIYVIPGGRVMVEIPGLSLSTRWPSLEEPVRSLLIKKIKGA